MRKSLEFTWKYNSGKLWDISTCSYYMGKFITMISSYHYHTSVYKPDDSFFYNKNKKIYK